MDSSDVVFDDYERAAGCLRSRGTGLRGIEAHEYMRSYTSGLEIEQREE